MSFRLCRLGLQGVCQTGLRQAFASKSKILSWACALLQSPPNSEPPIAFTMPAKASLPRAAPPVRSLPLQRFPIPRQQHNDAVYLTTPLASSGFLNLSTPSSTEHLAALFHAASALGVVPFRALFLPRSRTSSPTPYPLLSLSPSSAPLVGSFADWAEALSAHSPTHLLQSLGPKASPSNQTLRTTPEDCSSFTTHETR
jgi:hypothetical protein